MRQDLFELRSLISQYTLDKQKAPQSLDDLVTAGYIKTLPKDPMTNESNWEVVQEDVSVGCGSTGSRHQRREIRVKCDRHRRNGLLELVTRASDFFPSFLAMSSRSATFPYLNLAIAFRLSTP